MTIKVGIVKVTDPIKCTARVLFEDTGLLSGELQLSYKSTSGSKEYFIPSIEEQVLVALTEQKVGYIIGSLYSEADPPPIGDSNKRQFSFNNGASFTYDMTANTLAIIGIQDVIIDGISFKNHTHSGVHGETSSPNGGG